MSMSTMKQTTRSAAPVATGNRAESPTATAVGCGWRAAIREGRRSVDREDAVTAVGERAGEPAFTATDVERERAGVGDELEERRLVQEVVERVVGRQLRPTRSAWSSHSSRHG